MGKPTERELQLRVMREARFSSRGGMESRPSDRKAEAAVGPREAKFDRIKYQREYMRKWRAKKTAKVNA